MFFHSTNVFSFNKCFFIQRMFFHSTNLLISFMVLTPLKLFPYLLSGGDITDIPITPDKTTNKIPPTPLFEGKPTSFIYASVWLYKPFKHI